MQNEFPTVEELSNGFSEFKLEEAKELKDTTIELFYEDDKKVIYDFLDKNCIRVEYENNIKLIEDMGLVWGDSFDVARETMSVIEAEINRLTEEGLDKNIDKITELKAEYDELAKSLKEVKTVTENVFNFEALASSGLNILTGSFSSLFELIASGEATWDSFAKAGLMAIASLLDALSQQLAVQAITALFDSPPNYATFGLATAGALTASIGAGLVRGWAGQFATGGIVPNGNVAFDGTDNLLASVKAGEVILNHAQAINTARLLQRDGSKSIVINFNDVVYGDKDTIATMVYDKIKVLQTDGRLGEW